MLSKDKKWTCRTDRILHWAMGFMIKFYNQIKNVCDYIYVKQRCHSLVGLGNHRCTFLVVLEIYPSRHFRICFEFKVEVPRRIWQFFSNSLSFFFFQRKIHIVEKHWKNIECGSKIVQYIYIYTKIYSFGFDILFFCDTSGYTLAPMKGNISINKFHEHEASLAMSTNGK